MPAADQVWAMVSGLPRGKRERRKLMVLQAYIDDSGSEPRDPFFVLGGFVTQAADWAAFSDKWQVVLDIPPILEYFKMSEANSLRDQFDPSRGWDKNLRDIRVNLLCDVVCEHTSLATHVYLKHADFEKYIRSLLLPYRALSSDHPYPLLVMQLIMLLANFKSNIGDESGDSLDIFLDTQTRFEEEVMRWWSLFEDYDDFDGSKLAERLGNPPIFRNSKKFNPLQAADMFSWHRRNYYLTKNKTPILKRLEDRPTLMCPIGEKSLREIGEMLASMAAAFSIVRPDMPLLPASKGARQRTRRRDG